MKTAEELRASWNRNDDLREAWKKIVESPEWHVATTLLAAEAVKESRFCNKTDADPILARQLKKLDGALEAIEALQLLWKLPAAPEPEPEPFDEAYVTKLKAQKEAQRA